MSNAPSSQEKSSTSSPEERKPVRGRKRWLFRLFALFLGLLPFVLLEVILILLNVGKPTQFDDPFVGFSSIHPLFEKEGNQQSYVTAPSRLNYFGEQKFSASKPENGFRVFCLGGSTVRGKPHDTLTSFCRWLEIELQGRDPSRKYEVVNCGGVSYASYRLRHVLEEVLEYQPDLIVLATGHNEYLEDRTYHELKSRSETRKWFTNKVYSLRTVTLARQMFHSEEKPDRVMLTEKIKEKLNEDSGYTSYHRNDQWWQDVANHYRLTVDSMVQKCKAKGVPILLVNLGENLRDSPPFKSEHKPGLSLEQETEWQTAFELASRQEAVDPKEALKQYREAEKIDAEHGLLLYRIARCRERQGEQKLAERYYRKAKEWDICPLRMRDSLHDVLRQIAKAQQVPLVDVEKLLTPTAPHQSPGFETYVDHVHPTMEGHQKIAQALLVEMQRQGLVSKTLPEWSAKQRRDAYRQHVANLPPTFRAGSKMRLLWLETWARYTKAEVIEEASPFDAQGHRRWGLRHLEIFQNAKAAEEFQKAAEASPELEEDLLDDVLRFVQQGRPEAGQVILDVLIRSVPKNRKNHLMVSMILAVQQNDRKRATDVYPSYEQAAEPETGLAKGWQSLQEETLMELQR